MIDSLDIQFLREINLNRPVSLDGLFVLLTDTGPILAALLPIVFILLGFIRQKKQMWSNGLLIGGSYLLSVMISNLLKYLVNRPRPHITYHFIQKLSGAGSSSFPSGHTSDVFSIAMIISLLYPRRLVVVPIFVWAILVGYSRMDLGVHYPSDVVGGALIGVVSAVLAFKLRRQYSARVGV
ncbi:MAG: phosphatase PAP2 family protein [bacterium]